MARDLRAFRPASSPTLTGSTVFKTWAARYALFGVLFGLLFPIVATLAALERRSLPISLETVALVQIGEAGGLDRWLVDTAPVVLGGLLFVVGRQRDQRERDVRRLRAMAEVRRALSAATGMDTLLDALAPKWAQLIDADECLYAAWDEARNAPAPLHPRSRFDPTLAALPVPPDNTPLTQWVVTHMAVKILDPAGATPGVLAAPLAVNNRAFGVTLFSVQHPTRRFSADDAAAVLAVTDQVALTINHARTSAEIRRHARDMEGISQVARRIAAGWDIDRILTTVADSVQVRFGMDYVGILTVDEPAGEFVMRAQSGPLALDSALIPRQPLGSGLLGRTYASGRQVLARDVRQEPDYVAITKPDVRSELVMPLRSGKRVIGVIVFGSRYSDSFHQEDILALQMLADQVAVAVENTRLYDAAQHERQRLSAVLASTGDAVIVTDAADRVQLFNRAAERFFGVPAEQVIGSPLDDVLRLSALVDAYRNAAEAQVFELALSDATTLMGNLTLVRDEALGLQGRVLTLHDISDLKQLDQLKSQMIRMASHDLRNPLNLAFGYLDLLEGAVAGSDKARQYFDGVASGLRRMQKLIQDLLDVERIESSTERVRESVDVNDLAQRAADELRSQAEGKRHELNVQPAEKPARVSADPVQIYQVAVNLVSNAIKYTPDGGRIEVRVQRDSDAVIFEVVDNGLGIPQEAQVRLFQRFYRVKMRGTEDIEGTGLGLSLVKAVVEQHQGTIGVDSQEGRGSTFRVRLPALSDNAA